MKHKNKKDIWNELPHSPAKTSRIFDKLRSIKNSSAVADRIQYIQISTYLNLSHFIFCGAAEYFMRLMDSQ
jgi:hypothetical protein